LSWTSATWMPEASVPACLNALRAATLVASKRVMLSRCASARVSDACPEASTFTGVSVYFLALSMQHRTTAAAPSDIGAQSNMPRGSATGGDLRTASSFISFWYCALGLREPCLWFLTATMPICSRVVPNSCMWRRAMRACSAGNVAPKAVSHCWSAAVAWISVDSTSPTSVIFSAPPTTTMSCIPEATAK